MKLYTILFLMLFLGYPYPALSGQVSTAKHKAILLEIEKVEQNIHGKDRKITNFKTNLTTLKNLLNEKSTKGDKIIFKDKKKTLAKTNRVLSDFDVLKAKNEPCHGNGCDDLGDHLKKLASAIRRDSTPEEMANARKPKAGASTAPATPTTAAPVTPTAAPVTPTPTPVTPTPAPVPPKPVPAPPKPKPTPPPAQEKPAPTPTKPI